MKKNVKIKGITYTVHSSSETGLKDAIAQLKRSIKRMTEEDGKEEA